MKFSRTKNIEKLLEELNKQPLYDELLKNDENVFMALRDNEIHFYYGGSRIYKFTKNGFFSHKEFCINTAEKNEYINQNQLKSVNLITDIVLNYEPIKKNAIKYADIEDKGISNLFKQDYNSNKDIFLLDIEIALENGRIDILLYNNKTQTLKFIEAKDYSNKELWSKIGTKPKVSEQIEKYNDDLTKFYDDILEEYKKYILHLNNFFGLKINEPIKIIETTSLYMFGFDQNQKAKIEKLLKNDNSLENINYYFNGDAKKINVETLFSKS